MCLLILQLLRIRDELPRRLGSRGNFSFQDVQYKGLGDSTKYGNYIEDEDDQASQTRRKEWANNAANCSLLMHAGSMLFLPLAVFAPTFYRVG